MDNEKMRVPENDMQLTDDSLKDVIGGSSRYPDQQIEFDPKAVRCNKCGSKVTHVYGPERFFVELECLSCRNAWTEMLVDDKSK